MTVTKKTTIIFDFDGTIADSVPVGMKILNELSEEYGFRKIEEKDLPLFQNMSPMQLLKEFKVPLYKVPWIGMKTQAKMKERINEVAMIEGMPEVLRELKKRGYILGVLTSNSKENVELFLQLHEILDVFSFIHGEKNLFGKHKAFAHLIQKYNLSKKEILYLGDEMRDIEACKKVDVDIASVTWSFNSKEALEKLQPQYILMKPSELLLIL